jgi:hypothetical protein
MALCDGDCLVIVARHFIDTWKPLVKKASSRAQGGSDDEANLVALCSCHHLRGIHGGYIRVWGLAPDGLVWKLGGELWTGSIREEEAIATTPAVAA